MFIILFLDSEELKKIISLDSHIITRKYEKSCDTYLKKNEFFGKLESVFVILNIIILSIRYTGINCCFFFYDTNAFVSISFLIEGPRSLLSHRPENTFFS